MAASKDKSRIAILASGAGTNAEKIIAYFKDHDDIDVSLVISNRQGAGVLGIADRGGLPHRVIAKHEFGNEDLVLGMLDEYQIDFIVLAGFLLLIPPYLVRAYPQRIINIHPALLPKYGGKGMYGMHVHEAVKAAGDSESGITIHFVNERYDEGAIVFQKSTAIDHSDSPKDIAHKVQKLEHTHFPKVIEACVRVARLGGEEA